MALVRNPNLKKFDKIVTPISLGVPFISWAESKAQELVEQTSKKKNYVDINKILDYKNILIQTNDSSFENSPFKATLTTINNKFEIHLNEKNIFNDFERKFIIAHEIAHTFFYFEDNNETKNFLNLSYGSKQIEDICDYLALCILLPKMYMEEEILNYKNENPSLRNRNESFLKFIFHLSAKYQVDWHYLAFRLICLLNFLANSLCIEFSKSNSWEIKWVFQTDSLSEKKLFLPLRSKIVNKFPSAKESFSSILDDILTKHKSYASPYGFIIVKKDHFEKLYQGNFKQFLLKYFTDDYDKLKIYYRINKMDNIILLFPFDGLLKFKTQLTSFISKKSREQ